MIYIKTLKNTSPIKNVNFFFFFDDMIAVMLSNKKLNPIVTELFIRGTKLNIAIAFIVFIVFISIFGYFSVLKILG